MSISENRVFPTAICCYAFGYCLCPSLKLFNAMSFIYAEIPPEMFLQIPTETSDILLIHRRVWY